MLILMLGSFPHHVGRVSDHQIGKIHKTTFLLQSLEFLWTFQVFSFARELFKIQVPGTCLILSAGTFGGIIEPHWRPGGKKLRNRFKEGNGCIWRDGASLVAQIVNNLPMMQDTQVLSLGQEYSLEKGMATHSCILAWRIPWTEEPDRLQRVGHNWMTKTHILFHGHSFPRAP